MKFVVPVLALWSASLFAADISTVEEIVAKCNSDIVTRGDLDRNRRELLTELRQSGLSGLMLEQQMSDREKNLLRDKIDQLLLVQKAKDLDIKVDAEVTKQIATLQQQSGIADPDKFHEYVKEQSGMSYEDFKDQITRQAYTQHVIRQEVSEKLNVKHEELEKYYNEHKADFVREEQITLQEILISTDGKDAAGVAAAEKKAKDLVARARRGERFAEMARDNSDSVSAKEMGELPPYKKGQLAQNLENAVWSQPKGYITDPIQLPTGYLILRVEDHQKEGQAELGEVENQIMDKVIGPRMNPAIRDYLTKLRQEAFLQVKSDWIDSGAAPGKDTSWADPMQLRPETVSKKLVSTKTHRKRLLWMVPVPGTSTGSTSTSRS